MKEVELSPGWLQRQMDETQAEVAKWPPSMQVLKSINSDIGPQRGPASVARIEAQTKAINRELGEIK